MSVRIVSEHSENKHKQIVIGEFDGTSIEDNVGYRSMVFKPMKYPDCIALSTAYDWEIVQRTNADGSPGWITMKAYRKKENNNE